MPVRSVAAVLTSLFRMVILTDFRTFYLRTFLSGECPLCFSGNTVRYFVGRQNKYKIKKRARREGRWNRILLHLTKTKSGHRNGEKLVFSLLYSSILAKLCAILKKKWKRKGPFYS